MILSRLENRGTLRGVVQRSAPQDYEELINLPSMNGETIMGSKSGHDYGLANLDDIPTVPGVMTGATAGTDGAAGLTPKPLAGEEGKVLFGDGTWKIINTKMFIDTANILASGNVPPQTDFSYTATEDCFFTAYFYVQGSSTVIYIDSVPIIELYVSINTSWYYVLQHIEYYLKKGQTISFNIHNSPQNGSYKAFALMS